MTHLTAQVTINDWKEEELHKTEGGHSNHLAKVTYDYQGDLTGTSQADYILTYHPDGTASFVALEVIAITGDAPGTLVLRHRGRHADNVASAECDVVYGTGKFEGSTGTASYAAGDRTYTLEIDLA